MAADDAWSAEIKRLPFTPDPLALDEDLAERLLDGDLRPDQAPPGYAEVAALLAAAVAAPSPAELAGQEAALAELRAATRARRALPRATGRPGRRRRVGLLVAVAVCGLSTTGIAAATTGTLPDPIRNAARRILATVDDATSMPSTTPGRQPAPGTGDGAAVGATSEGQGARPAGVPEATVGPGAVNDDPCRASKVGKGADRSKKPNAVTSQARSKRLVTPTTSPASVRNPNQTAPGATGRRSIPRPTAMGVDRAASRPRTRGASPGRDGRDHLRTAVAAARRRGGRSRQGRAGPSPRRADDRDGATRWNGNLAARVPGLTGFAVPAVVGLVPLILEPLVGLVIALVGSVRPLGWLGA